MLKLFEKKSSKSPKKVLKEAINNEELSIEERISISKFLIEHTKIAIPWGEIIKMSGLALLTTIFIYVEVKQLPIVSTYKFIDKVRI